MKAKGNKDIHTCANNLLRTFKGEVPYERLKGLSARMIDLPSEDAVIEAQQSAEWMFENFEPRAVLNGVSVEFSEGYCGGFNVTADITEKGA